ncbi:hypothetical protein [Streptomyces olivaceus]|uniref:hypothetical protein n=1 Tax=Streptomyces olivaceus TaxID=47716 RepID=UPI0022EF31B7|nr:hypothetical protein [Streptomyces olivaceus]GHI91752.1 hypothetical protein TPA0905_12230 [Streptomyces olivaceus]
MADILFDLRGGATPVFADPPPHLDQTRVHQQHCYEPNTGLVYATQVIANGVQLADESEPPPTGTRDARGDIAVTRLTLDGTITGVMYCRAFDHGNGIGAEYDEDTGTTWLWLSYDAQMQEIGSGINGHGRRLVRLEFVDGAIVDVGDPGLDVYDPIGGTTHIQPLLDLAHHQMGISYSTGNGTYIAVYDLTDFKARNFSPLRQFLRPQYPLNQSSALYGNYLYLVHGRAYGSDNPPPPDGTGDAYFTVIDVRDGRAIDRIKNDYALDLPYREPESIYVWETVDGPQLVFGFATDDPPRRMALYAVTATIDTRVPIAAVVVDRPTPGVQLTVSVTSPTTIQTWQISRQVAGVRQTVFSGTRLAEDSVWLDSAPPGCLPLVYVLTIHRTNGATEEHVSDTVTYTPPGGCGSGGAVAPNDTVLGCPADYTAVIHWRGGAQPYLALDDLTAVSWTRTINDVSEGSVTLARADLSADCCAALGRIEPWVHELSLYRDGELVWQGPVVRPRFRRDSITIEALDVFAWLDKLVNTSPVRYVTAGADALGRRRGPITYIAYNHLRLNLTETVLSSPPDYPEILPYLVRRDAGLPTISVEKDGSDNVTPWNIPVGDLWREWTKRGLTWTTVGRSLLLRGRADSTARAVALLTLDHIAGDVEVIKDGTQAATYSFASTQQSQDVSEGSTLGTGVIGSPYGRLDTLVVLQEEDATLDDLRQAARTGLAGRYPAPTVISVPDQAQLTADAPVTIRQLVPGERLDVLADSMCVPIAQGFVLSDVDVTWQDGSEKVGIALIPLADVEEELT